jgi:hypothetical protein
MIVPEKIEFKVGDKDNYIFRLKGLGEAEVQDCEEKCAGRLLLPWVCRQRRL